MMNLCVSFSYRELSSSISFRGLLILKLKFLRLHGFSDANYASSIITRKHQLRICQH